MDVEGTCCSSFSGTVLAYPLPQTRIHSQEQQNDKHGDEQQNMKRCGRTLFKLTTGT
jgi:hypothetical protein